MTQVTLQDIKEKVMTEDERRLLFCDNCPDFLKEFSMNDLAA